jgi:deoxyguanosine kinase
VSLHIAIEGVIGVGKTTLARALARAMGAALLLEKPKDNPFLERFYKEPERYALSTQLCFLLERADQLQDAAQGKLFEQRVVADFTLAKDAIFAKLNLSDSEYTVYETVHAHLSADRLSAPDLVIYLKAPIALCRERIEERGIAMEQGIPDAYLERLDLAYTAFFANYRTAPVLFLDAARQSPAMHHKELARLLQDIEQVLAREVNLPPIKTIA